MPTSNEQPGDQVPPSPPVSAAVDGPSPDVAADGTAALSISADVPTGSERRSDLVERMFVCCDNNVVIVGIAMYSVAVVTVILAFILSSKKSSELHAFVVLELLAVICAFHLSVRSYKSSVRGIREKVAVAKPTTYEHKILLQERMSEQLFAIGNVVPFYGALATAFAPVWHLFAIQAIYFLFFLNNSHQANRSFELVKNSQLQDIRKHGAERTLDLLHWCRVENGPTVIGYWLVIFVVAIIVVLRQGVSPDMIEVFAAGVAGYHLALSTISYRLAHTASTARLIRGPCGDVLLKCDEFKEQLTSDMKPTWLPWAAWFCFITSIPVAIWAST